MNDFMTLDAETAFSQLEQNTGSLPEAAIRFAVERWEDISPLFLEELRDVAADPDSILAKGDGYFRHLYALYLAAQCRETTAYSYIVDLLSHPGEVVDYLLGDVVTEDLDRIIASVCGSDLDPIKQLVENPLLDEYVRSAALESMFCLFAEDRLDREYILGYLQELFSTKIERQPSFLWCSMVNLACDLYPEELSKEIDRAYSEHLVDPSDVSPKDVAEALSVGKEIALRESRRYSKGLIDDAAAELRSWVCFNRTEVSSFANNSPNQEPDRDFAYYHAGTYTRESP
jgi:hypothetical protein